MSDWEQLGETIEAIGRLLDEPTLEPDPDRGDWERATHLLNQVSENVDRLLLPKIDAGLAEARAENPDAEQALRAHLVGVMGEVAALYLATPTRDGWTLLQRAVKLAPHGEPGQEITAASGDPAVYTRLVHARWLKRKSRGSAAKKILKQLLKESHDPVFVRLAKNALAAGQPITSAPPLNTLNGCGVGIYGSRDEHADGSYVTTYFFLLLFFPVFPITAYRVAREDDGYIFLQKVPLGRLARAYRALVLGSILLAIILGSTSAYLNSPTRKATLMLKDAQALEAQGDHKHAVEKYEQLVETYGHVHTDAIADARQALFAAYVADVPDPFSEAHMEKAVRAAGRVKNLSPGVTNETSLQMVQQLESWSDAIRARTPSSMRAAQRLLHLAVELSWGQPPDDLKTRQRVLALGLAAVLAKERPVDALRIYLSYSDDPEALVAASRVVHVLGNSLSLWDENRALIERYTQSVGSQTQHAETVALAVERLQLASALANDENRKQLLAAEEPDEKALRRWLASHRLDQHVAVALATLLRNRGDAQPALDVILKQGNVGWLIVSAQSLLAYLHFDQGKLKAADAVLTPLLAQRLPVFQEVSRKLNARAERLQDELLAKVRGGQLPPMVQSKINNATTDQAANRLFDEYTQQQFREDAELARLREEYQHFGAVVSDALTLGIVKLQLASGASGQARQILLDAAEYNLLAIREDAEGMPQYHMSLGKMYHRMNKAEEGERELAGVLARNDATLSLQVALVYRDLGLDKRAMTVATSVYENSSASAERQSAAELLATVASEVEQTELWLSRADQSLPHVQTQLASVRAMRAFREGRFEEAELGYANVVTRYQKDIKTMASAANNAALANRSRYLSSANRAHLVAARKGLERALRLHPDSSIIMSNLAEVYLYEGLLDILSQHVRAHALRLNGSKVFGMVYRLADGPLREQLIDALKKNQSVRKSIDLTGREIVLAPNRLTPRARNFQIHILRRDVAALHDWLDAAGKQKLDHSRLDDKRKDADSTSARKARRQSAATVVKLAERALADATKLHHKETVALANQSLADALQRLSTVTNDVASAERAIPLLETANELWPALRADRSLVWAHVRLAIAGAGAASPKLAALLDSDGHQLADSSLLHRMATLPDGKELVAVVRAQPAMKSAMALLRGPAGDNPSIGQWIVANMFGDAALTKAAAGIFQQEHKRLGAKVSNTMDPGSPEGALRQKLWRQHKAN